VDDFEHPDTTVAMNFSGTRAIFVAGGPTPAPESVDPPEVLEVPDALIIGDPHEIEWSVFGDADGSVWTTTVGPWRDITAAVAAENPFNDDPPDGLAFVGFDVEMTLVRADKEPLSTGFNLKWEILGGATRRVYGEGSFADVFGCGVSPDAFDPFAEVFAGGTLSGTVCIPLPIEDLENPYTRIAMNFDGDRVVFAEAD